MTVAADLRSRFSGAWRVWLFNVGVALACAGIWTFAVHQWDAPHLVAGPRLQWWMLAIAFYLAEVFVVHLQFRKQAHTLSLTEIGLTLGLLLASPVALLVGQLAGTFVALTVNRWRSQRLFVKLFFNAAELPLCSGIALVIFRSFASPGDSLPHVWLLALLAASAAHTTGVVLVSAVIAIHEGRFHAPQLSRTLVTSLVGAIATACLGLSAVGLMGVRPLALVLLAVPVAACVLAFRGYMTQREQREHVEFLYESMRATQGAPEFGLAVGQLLVAARRLLRAEFAEILLLPPNEDEGPLRSVSGSQGELLMHPEERLAPQDAAAFQEVTAAAKSMVLTRRRNAHELDAVLRARGIEDAIVGPLRGEDRMFGLLIVGDRAGDVSTFDEDALALFDTFSGHASILLENGRLEHSLAQVTDLKEQLRHQAYHDALTDLPNRRHLLEAVEQEIERTEAPVAILYLDLDRFKVVNDTWGHSAGDELLVQFAQRLRAAVRGHDLAARLGGDEFAVLVRDADVEAAVATARRVLDSVGGTYSLSSGEITCHASVGVAVATPETVTADDLVRNADIAMYSVKRSDRSYTVYEAELHEELRAQRQLALELEAALERREIVVHYQPVVRLADGSVQGFEVLARWQHPTRGLLPAAEFLPIAEETGLVVELGVQVLEQALDAARSWPRELSLWVNLAPAELANERLVETLSAALERAGIEPARLTIEVTESSVLQSEESALEAMRRLRELGVSLTIDDFGTGYSSLSRLAEFPIESLKIPKPFVDRLVGADADEAFVDAILRLGDSLGLAAVGEGIEHASQADRLRELGCLLGQGYFFGRPAPLDEIQHLLQPVAVRPRLPLERLAASA